MEKIKNILRPGHEKDDETLYGSGQGQHASSSQHADAQSSAERREGDSSGLTHESSNLGTSKHSEQAYGQTGSQLGAQQLPQTTSGNQPLHTSSAAAQQDRGGLSQTVNPSGDRYDNSQYGTSTTMQPATTGTPTRGEHGITSWTAASNTTSSQPPAGGAATGVDSSSSQLSHHVHNSVTATPTTHSHAANNAASGTTTRHLDDQTHSHSHGRDAALAGGAAAATGLAASHTHEARDRHDQSGAEGGLTHHVHNYLYEGPAGSHSSSHQHGTQSGNATTTSALQPPRPVLAEASSAASIKSGVVGREPQVLTQPGLATGANANATSSSAGTGGALPSVPNTGGSFMGEQGGAYSGTSDRSIPLSGAGTSSTLPDRTAGHNTAGGNHGREGLAAAAGAASAIAVASQAVDHRHQGSGHDYLGANIDEKTPTGGPHATVVANKLDPHLHGSRSINSDATGTGVSSKSTTKNDHHLGRDAAVAGGLGAGAAGAAGAYAVGRNAGTDTGPAPNTIGPHDKDWKNILDPRVQPQPALQKSAGPDATGPASNTIGPHDKDWKNVIDPRVQPDPSLQKPASAAGNTGPAANTVGPHDKDWKNVLDPRVKPDPTAQKGDHSAAAATGVAHPTQHQARDAGLVGGGGALAAAGAAYGAGHHSSNTGAGTAGTTGTAATSASSTAPGTAVTTSGQHATPAPATSTTGTSHEHHGARDVAAAGGAGAAGLAASRAFHKHDTVVGEKGLSSKGANPYSSQGLDPRVDGSHPRHTTSTTGPASTTGGATGTDTKHHFGRDTAIAGATLGAGGIGAHELSQHHGERVAGEGLGAHDPATHHGVGGTSTSTGTTTHGTTGSAIPGHSLTTDRAADTYPSPSDNNSNSKLSHARSDVAHQAHAEHQAGTTTEKKESLGDKIKGMLHIGSGSGSSAAGDDHAPTAANEENLQPHLHHDDRNRLHKEPRHGYPSSGPTGTTGTGTTGTTGTAGTAASEGTTIGTGSGITAATVPASEGGATKTGRELGA